MDTEMKSIGAMVNFRDNLKVKEEYGNDGCKFNGLVTYYALNEIFNEELEVFLITSGYEPIVKLDIYEKGEIIKLDKFHLDFDPKYPNTIISFDKELNSLKINGKNSPKLGNYELTIVEK